MIVILGETVERWSCIYADCKALCCRASRELTPRDVKLISEKTGLNYSKFLTLSSGAMPFKLKLVGGKCVFLGEDYGCSLHSLNAKPLLCRIYPFMLSKVHYGDEPIMQLSPVKECPGYGFGEKLDDAFLTEVSKVINEYLSELRRVISLKKSGLGPEEVLRKLA